MHAIETMLVFLATAVTMSAVLSRLQEALGLTDRASKRGPGDLLSHHHARPAEVREPISNFVAQRRAGWRFDPTPSAAPQNPTL